MNLNIVEITSESNSRFKMLKSLGTKNGRKKNKKFFVEGPESIIDALKTKVNPREVFFSESFYKNENNKQILSDIEKRQADIFLLADNLFKKLSFTENPKGIIMTVDIIECDYIKVLTDSGSNRTLYIICECIQDPGNLGTIIRSADGAAADGVFLSKGCVDMHNPKVIRASMGSIFNIPVVNVEDMELLIKMMKNKNINIYSTSPNTNNNIFKENFVDSLCILIGNEGQGLTDKIIKLSDKAVKIPMLGKAESLNASIATGILLYEVTRQRLEKEL